MFKKHITLLIILFTTSLFAQSKKIEVTGNEIYKDSLSSDSVHQYTVKADSATFLFGKVIQESVDLAITVKDPEGKIIAKIDGPAAGPEIFTVQTSENGDYQFEITPFENAEGIYTFQLLKKEPLASTKEGKIDQLMMRYNGNDVPGAEVLVLKDGKVLFKKAYGMANLSYDIPFKTTTLTNIGSTSKQFTAFAINLLAQQGKLSLDDDIRKYFPEFPKFDQKVTIRNLLSHTSGYREFLNTFSMTGRDLTSSLNREMILRLIENQPKLQDEPGTEFNYNNTGFAILAALVRRVTDTPFPEWMKMNVFKPLQMDHTIVRANSTEIIKNRAAGYTTGAKGEYVEVQDLDGSMGAGGIYTTLDDLSKWIENLHSHQLGGNAIYEEMTTRFILKNGDTIPYGQGLSIGNYKGQKIVQHGGSDNAHRSMLMYFPEFDGAVITQSNFAGFDSNMAYKIADIYFEDQFKNKNHEEQTIPKAVAKAENGFEYDPEKFDALVGDYALVNVPNFVISFTREDHKLFTQATKQPKLEIRALADSIFELKKVNARLTFHLEEDGSAQSVTLHQNGMSQLAKKVEKEEAPQNLKDYVGTYYSEEIQTVYKVKLEENELVLFNYQIGKNIKLFQGKDDSFSSEFPFSQIDFKKNDSEEIAGFYGSNGRTKNIYFKKIE